jgi:acyl-coenzyme A synthetase/AMP-(fatty) acid ligase
VDIFKHTAKKIRKLNEQIRFYLKCMVRFIPVPKGVQISHGTHLYRTGDWGYMLSDGGLEICGRCDSMVKIRGYSIEVQVIKQKLINIWYQKYFVFI